MWIHIQFKVFLLILHVTKIIKNIDVSNRDLNLTTAGHYLVKFKVKNWEKKQNMHKNPSYTYKFLANM